MNAQPQPTTWQFDLLLGPLKGALAHLGEKIPAILAALILLVAGVFVARGLRALVNGLLNRLRFDEYAGKIGVNDVLSRLGLGKSPVFAVSFLVYWFVLFVFIVSAANAVNMTAISSLIERFALFLPSVIVAVIILFGGLLFGGFLSGIINNAAKDNGLRGGPALGQAAYVTVVVFAAMTALDQLHVNLGLVSNAIQILMASAGIAVAIAFGLGGKDVAAEIIRGWVKK